MIQIMQIKTIYIYIYLNIKCIDIVYDKFVQVPTSWCSLHGSVRTPQEYSSPKGHFVVPFGDFFSNRPTKNSSNGSFEEPLIANFTWINSGATLWRDRDVRPCCGFMSKSFKRWGAACHTVADKESQTALLLPAIEEHIFTKWLSWLHGHCWAQARWFLEVVGHKPCQKQTCFSQVCSMNFTSIHALASSRTWLSKFQTQALHWHGARFHHFPPEPPRRSVPLLQKAPLWPSERFLPSDLSTGFFQKPTHKEVVKAMGWRNGKMPCSKQRPLLMTCLVHSDERRNHGSGVKTTGLQVGRWSSSVDENPDQPSPKTRELGEASFNKLLPKTMQRCDTQHTLWNVSVGDSPRIINPIYPFNIFFSHMQRTIIKGKLANQ